VLGGRDRDFRKSGGWKRGDGHQGAAHSQGESQPRKRKKFLKGDQGHRAGTASKGQFASKPKHRNNGGQGKSGGGKPGGDQAKVKSTKPPGKGTHAASLIYDAEGALTLTAVPRCP
jgi:hypothetical protein